MQLIIPVVQHLEHVAAKHARSIDQARVFPGICLHTQGQSRVTGNGSALVECSSLHRGSTHVWVQWGSNDFTRESRLLSRPIQRRAQSANKLARRREQAAPPPGPRVNGFPPTLRCCSGSSCHRFGSCDDCWRPQVTPWTSLALQIALAARPTDGWSLRMTQKLGKSAGISTKLQKHGLQIRISLASIVEQVQKLIQHDLQERLVVGGGRGTCE